ncbi:MAG: VWA domain-containing protein, partial [Gammaproteobacteria bacterium]|nr:VWA domain-containing protein [Gammaproteobacteria bacterium]
MSDADLVVQAYGAKIQTLNPRGCGVTGYQIQLPISALTANQSVLSEDLTLALTNYKYGLFMENITELENEIPRNNSTQQKISPKQDILCEGRYPADVLIDNNSWKQFTANNSTTNNYTQPQFVLATRAQTHHYVLVLDQSNRMEFNLRWRNIKRSLNRFIANLQEGTMISIVTCAAEGSLVLPPTVVTAANREGIHGRIPRRTEDVSVACISCGLRLAQDVLTGSAAGTVLLLTGSNENDKVEDFAISGGKLFSILYPGLYSSAISSGAVYS